MKKNYLFAIIFAMLCTGCDAFSSKPVNEENQTTETVVSDVSETADTEDTIISEDTVVSEEKTEKSDDTDHTEADTEATESVSKSYRELTEDEKSCLNEEEVIEFLEALKSKDISKIASYACTTEEEVNSWISEVSIGDYEIIGNYNADDEKLNPFTLVKIDVISADGNVFKKGDDLYRFYGQDASSPIKAIQSDYKYTYENNELSAICHAYQSYIGVDFDHAEDLLEQPFIYSSLRSFGYVNHTDIHSMDDLTKAVHDNISIENFEWDASELAYDNNSFEPYELPPRGNIWYYYEVISDEGDRAVINYYADIFGFATSKTVEYQYERNETGAPRITAVHTIYEGEFDPAIGSV